MLLGVGCQQSGSSAINTNEPANIAVGEPNPAAPQQQSEEKEYVNTAGDYSFSYPSKIRQLKASDQKLSPGSGEVSIFLSGGDQSLVNPELTFKLIKTTVYPEHKIGLIAKEYFNKEVKTTSKQMKINNLSGWEITRGTPSTDQDYDVPEEDNVADDKPKLTRILYFPRANNELLVLDYSEGEQFGANIISTLKSIK